MIDKKELESFDELDSSEAEGHLSEPSPLKRRSINGAGKLERL